MLQYPLATEKALNLVDKENVIVYVVDLSATKESIKKEFEDMFKVKTKSINTQRTANNTKRAYIKLAPEFKASDLAKRLKLV